MKTDNELIAEFMSIKPYEDGRYGTMWPNPTNNNKVEFGLKYDTSWDWLMPVVEKIETICYVGLDAVHVRIEGAKCKIWTSYDEKEFLKLTGDDNNEDNKFKVGCSYKTKIESTYQCVVDFIKWYNEN
jgi:hypothetical protein